MAPHASDVLKALARAHVRRSRPDAQSKSGTRVETRVETSNDQGARTERQACCPYLAQNLVEIAERNAHLFRVSTDRRPVHAHTPDRLVLLAPEHVPAGFEGFLDASSRDAFLSIDGALVLSVVQHLLELARVKGCNA